MFTEVLMVQTPGRGFSSVTRTVAEAIARAGLREGLCNIFVRHTSASLLITENADPAVHRDLERFMQRIAPDGDPAYEHDAEGPDDMPAHIRSVLTASSVCVPIVDGRMALGTWQGIYLWEHRRAPHRRELLVSVVG